MIVPLVIRPKTWVHSSKIVFQMQPMTILLVLKLMLVMENQQFIAETNKPKLLLRFQMIKQL